MNAIDIANQYLAAWNRHDADALSDIFTRDGTYCDPTTQGKLTGSAIAANAQSLWAALPDLSFKILSAAEARLGVVAAEWIMRGTNTGEFRGLPATGKTVALPGADFITVEGDKIRAVTGYFDTRAIPRTARPANRCATLCIRPIRVRHQRRGANRQKNEARRVQHHAVVQRHG